MIPSTSRAAVLVDFGQSLEIREVEVPTSLEPGSILVRTAVATVCGTDVHRADGTAEPEYHAAAQLPVILGHEMTGHIVRLGEGVSADSIGQPLAVGDRIIWAHGFCGHCLNCVVEHRPTLCSNRRGYMMADCTTYPYLTGGFSEYCYVFPSSGRVKVPDEISDPVASAASCALRTVVHGFDRLGALDDRHHVVIQGAGPLGLFAVAKAVSSGPANVIVIGGPRQRLDLATSWGAHHTLDVAVTSVDERVEAVLGSTNGRGADVVVEVSGVPEAFLEGMQLLRPGGRYLVVGQLHSQEVGFNPTTLVRKHAHLIGSLSGSIEHYYRGLEFLRHHADRFAWDDLTPSHYPLERIDEAFARMRSWDEIKPVIDFH